MTTRIKVFSPSDKASFADFNNEFDHLLAVATNVKTSSIVNGAITQLKLADDANVAVFMGEIYRDSFVIGFVKTGTSGLTGTLGVGTAFIFDSSGVIDKMLRVNKTASVTHTLAPNTTNFIDLGSDGIFDVTQTPAAAVGHTRLHSFTTDGSSVTADARLADEAFPEQQTLFPWDFANLDIDVLSTTEVKLTSGFEGRDSTNTHTITTTADITADITNPVGALGLDQGTEASDTWYAVVLIDDTTGVNPPSLILVAEANYPSAMIVPATHDIFRRVGWLRNDSSSDFLLGTQHGTTFTYDDEHDISTSFSSTPFVDIASSSFTSPTSRLAHMSAETADTPGNSSGISLFYTKAGITASSGGIKVLSTLTGNEAGDRARQAVSFSNVPIDSSTDRDTAYRSVGTAVENISVTGYEDPLDN